LTSGRAFGRKSPAYLVLANGVCWTKGCAQHARSRWGLEGACKIGTPGDIELAVGVCEVHLDRLDGYEQRLRDLGVGRALGGEGCDPAFAGGERIHAGEPVPSYPYAAGCELLAGGVSQAVSSALASELIASAEWLARVASVARAALSASEVDERAGVFESPRGTFEVFDGGEQLLDRVGWIGG
jgi:hypothetical protein